MTHVMTVTCPVCEKPWTGEFADNKVEEAVCRPCLAQRPEQLKGHPDLHINPGGR